MIFSRTREGALLVNDSQPAAVIVLAAGEGTRMKSAIPKVLHRIGGRSLLGHAITAARGTEAVHLAVVVRHERELVSAHAHEIAPEAVIAEQDDIKGTGRAAECGLQGLPADLSGTVVVTYGDTPLLTAATLRDLVQFHADQASAATVVTAHLRKPDGYGRIIRDAAGEVAAIVEHKDATAEQREITEINSGIYAFDATILRTALAEVSSDNAQGEKYLTDVLRIARERGNRVTAYPIEDVWQTEGVNDRVQLATLGKELNRRTTQRWMRDGVTILDPDSTWIDADVSIGADTTVLPGTQLLGATTIGAGALVGPEVSLIDTEVHDGAQIRRAEAHLAVVGAGAVVGPYAYLRPGTVLGAQGKIGGFVETKNATIGEGAKVPHLTYCGDATIGAGANVGAGTIIANYDGQAKHHTVIGENSFVGSNTVLVAPVTVAAGAYVAAGSALTEDVHAGQLGIARARQRNLDEWVPRNRAGSKTAASAEAAQRHTTRDREDSASASSDVPGV